jgi:ribonuclease HII
MRRLAEQYPHYGFEHNMGYGTPEHLLALQTHGACSIHRRTFAPVYAVLEFELRG